MNKQSQIQTKCVIMYQIKIVNWIVDEDCNGYLDLKCIVDKNHVILAIQLHIQLHIRIQNQYL